MGSWFQIQMSLLKTNQTGDKVGMKDFVWYKNHTAK